MSATAETLRRSEREAKRLAREHALHARAHLDAGRYEEAVDQFNAAADYAANANALRREAERASR